MEMMSVESVVQCEPSQREIPFLYVFCASWLSPVLVVLKVPSCPSHSLTGAELRGGMGHWDFTETEGSGCGGSEAGLGFAGQN